MIDNLLGATHNASRFLQKNSPKILSITGMLLSTGACIATGIATWNSKDILEEHNVDIEDLHEDLKSATSAEEETEIKELIRKRYLKTVGDVAINYAPAGLMLGGSWVCGLNSMKQYEGRIATLGAGLMLLKKAYDNAKERAEEKYGEEEAADLFYGSKEKEITYLDENGNEKTKKIKEYDPYGILSANPCAIILGDGIDSNLTGHLWTDTDFIHSLEQKYTYVLNSDGYVLVQDIYKELGVKPMSKFQHDLWSTYGWFKDKEAINNFVKKCEIEGINYSSEDIIKVNKIDLGLSNYINDNYISGIEPTVWIIPNCFGDIMPVIYPDTQKDKYLE